jgi:hypothetical protein
MTPAEVTDAMLQTALDAVYNQPTRLDDVDPDTLDSWRLGIAAVLTLVAEEIEQLGPALANDVPDEPCTAAAEHNCHRAAGEWALALAAKSARGEIA